MDLNIYRKMYIVLFNAVTDALNYLDNKEYERCRDILVKAQLNCEEIHISSDSSDA